MKKKNKNKNKQKPYNLEFCHDLMMLVLYPGRPCNRTCHWLAGFMLLQANFNNISVISAEHQRSKTLLGNRGGDRMVVRFTTTCAISAYHY
jgi:hypothetical protein